MTAKEFLGQLEQCLSGLSADEREDAMAYYREYFIEAGEENEDDAAERLGSPQSVAQRIISEMGTVTAPESPAKETKSTEKSDSTRIIIAILVLVIGFPLWITVLSLWFAMVVTIIAIIVSFAFAGIVSPIGGIMDLFGGYVSSGICSIGGGIFCIGLVMLLWKPAWLGIKYSTLLIGKGIKKLFGRG